MTYVEWFWSLFMMEKAAQYQTWKSPVCKLIFPCHLYWQENYLAKASNDNRKM